MKIGVLFNERPCPTHPSPAPDDTYEEYDDPCSISAISRALSALDLSVEPVPADRHLAHRLLDGAFNFLFNIAEGPVTLTGIARRCRESLPAAVCELLAIPYTGPDPVTLGITLDKALARRIVSPEIPVAPAELLDDPASPEPLARLRYPAVVKPNDEGSSKGIHPGNLVSDPTAALAVAHRLHARYGCPVLVEEFLPGAEVTVALAGNAPNVRLLGMMEIASATPDEPFLYSLECKRDFRRRVVYHRPPRLHPSTLETIETYARAAWRLLGCRDLARFDFRLNAAGRPCFLECNPLPGLNPETSDVVILTQGRLPYDELIQGVLRDAFARTGVPLP